MEILIKILWSVCCVIIGTLITIRSAQNRINELSSFNDDLIQENHILTELNNELVNEKISLISAKDKAEKVLAEFVQTKYKNKTKQ